MNKQEKVELLATRVMGWYKANDYWYDSETDYSLYPAKPLLYHPIHWQPFENIIHAKEVQGKLLGKGWMTREWAKEGVGWVVCFFTELPEEFVTFVAETEAEAISEAAFLAIDPGEVT